MEAIDDQNGSIDNLSANIDTTLEANVSENVDTLNAKQENVKETLDSTSAINVELNIPQSISDSNIEMLDSILEDTSNQPTQQSSQIDQCVGNTCDESSTKLETEEKMDTSDPDIIPQTPTSTISEQCSTSCDTAKTDTNECKPSTSNNTKLDIDVSNNSTVSDSTDNIEKDVTDDEMVVQDGIVADITGEAESTAMDVDTSNSVCNTANRERNNTQSDSITSTSVTDKPEPVTDTITQIEITSAEADALPEKSSSTVQEDVEKSKIESPKQSGSEDKDDVSKSTNIELSKEPTEVKNSSKDNDHSEETAQSENPVFVHVSTENEKEDRDKTKSVEDKQDEEDFQNSQPQEDPIASDDFPLEQMDDENDDTEPSIDEEQGSSEALCIIPDTERVISQEEKDAAASMVPLREISETNNAVDTPKKIIAEQSKEVEESKYIVSTCTDENVNPCVQCCLPRKSKYSVLENNKTTFICDDNCLTAFKNKFGNNVVLNVEGDLRVKNLSSGINDDNMVSKVTFLRKCMECEKQVLNNSSNLSWETMEFCNELCLSKYQKKTGSNCASCQAEVRSNCLGKYCVRFGYDIRQFCSSVCLEEYKKGLKVCTYCQKDMSRGGDGFLAPVGDKGQFKDFCTQHCMEKYDVMSNNREQPVIKAGSTCSVCPNDKPITIEFEHDKKINLFCGEPCFVAFKFVNNITPGKCDMCKKYFDNKVLELNSMYYDNAQHSFCSKSCQNIYIIAHRKIVPCSWCRVKKYNFDMIKRNNISGPTLMLCSLNCLSLYQVSISAVSSKKVKCDYCQKSLQPLYHLTMSDATLRNFCSYPCVMSFQSQFAKTPITLNEPEDTPKPVPTGAPKRSKKIATKSVEPPASVPADVPTIPVISNVQSLATSNGPTSTGTRSRTKNGSETTVTTKSMSPVVKTQIRQHIIVKPSPWPEQRNVATMCSVNSGTKGVQFKPNSVSKEVQTDDLQDKTAVIPIPVPIYVPTPMWMYSLPLPVPFPFPLPVPVPIFIPTTRNSAAGIMKEIKKIQVKIPTDPFEAELLMMAEMVAGDKKEDHTDSESEEEDHTAPPEVATFSPEPVDASNTFGDDMLQMALKMATELDEPAVDLEGALTANTITASQGAETTVPEETVDDPQPIHHMMERQVVRGRKRPGRPPRTASSKRGRRSSSHMDIPLMAPPQPPAPSEPIEKPDANMCLKYTFGVNAWKQWVTTKNAELEKSTRRIKLFKPEILQLTADELNYSLCLFVKEVRKPNGQEYAPDTIYYLCLGIQQYLFENGRIDNIFCDTYYEKFTDCLDEVAKKFSVLYNDSHYIVTRVEEEHLWESKQLGAHSPHVLLSTLMFFNTKHFNLTTVDEHMQLSFSHIMKHWKRNPNQPGTNKVAGSRNVLLRFYPPQTASEASTRKKKVYEQQENEENPLRCPVKLYEFYLSKWYGDKGKSVVNRRSLVPESVKTRNDVFYLLPERSCVPDSPVWYSTMPLPRNALEKMLHRVKMVKEINVALLTS